MKFFENLFLLRFALAVIMLMHSVPSFFDASIYGFGNEYLNANGFSPIGVQLAWALKISHVLAAICLILNRYIKIAGIVTIFVLIAGIIMVHFKEGWFVVGGGRNGVEFNFLLIFAFLAVMYPNGLLKKPNNL